MCSVVKLRAPALATLLPVATTFVVFRERFPNIVVCVDAVGKVPEDVIDLFDVNPCAVILAAAVMFAARVLPPVASVEMLMRMCVAFELPFNISIPGAVGVIVTASGLPASVEEFAAPAINDNAVPSAGPVLFHNSME